MTASGGASLRFPDGPKLELDELLDQLVVRAQDVRRAQGRLRALLRAVEAVTGELSVQAVLCHLATAARDLTGCGSAWVSVLGADGGVVRQVRARGDDGVGRLERSQTGLSVPVGVRDQQYAELHVEDHPHGGFSDEDAQLLTALAGVAGTAISNAELFEESRGQGDWLRATTEIAQTLLATDGEDPLDVVARAAMALADADLVTLALVDRERTELVVEVARGLESEWFLGVRYPLDDSLAWRAVLEARAFRVEDYHRNLVSPQSSQSTHRIGPAMVVPLVADDRVRGTLGLIRLSGRAAFSDLDLRMAAQFANHASVALELGEARLSEARVRLLEDRDRIGRDLHDHVIQELFAVGMSLEGLASDRGLPPATRDRLQGRVEDLDRTIRRIRTSIFALRGPLDGAEDVRRSVLDVTAELVQLLGFAPAVTFGGAPGSVPMDLADDVTAVVREALANVARHAHATKVSVDLTATAAELVLAVVDDGVGADGTSRTGGTANLRSRAERRGGSFSLDSAPVGGTALTWRVPLG